MSKKQCKKESQRLTCWTRLRTWGGQGSIVFVLLSFWCDAKKPCFSHRPQNGCKSKKIGPGAPKERYKAKDCSSTGVFERGKRGIEINIFCEGLKPDETPKPPQPRGLVGLSTIIPKCHMTRFWIVVPRLSRCEGKGLPVCQ